MRIIKAGILCFTLVFSMGMTEAFDPEAVVQRQLDAYNARDLERFVREYTEDVVVYRMPDPNPVIVGVGDAPIDAAMVFEVTEKGIAKVWMFRGE